MRTEHPIAMSHPSARPKQERSSTGLQHHAAHSPRAARTPNRLPKPVINGVVATVGMLVWAASVARSVPVQASENPATPDANQAREINLALVAVPSTSFVSGHERLSALNDGFTPRHSNDKRHGAYGNWPRTGTQWVQYEWSRPIRTGKVEVYWFDDGRGVRLPQACRLKYWDGEQFLPVPHPSGLGLEANCFNTTTFDVVTTTKLRLEMDGRERFSTGILEWRVYDAGGSPAFPPIVEAGHDRVLVAGGKTWLSGSLCTLQRRPVSLLWRKISGPGAVRFADPQALQTTATIDESGDYVLCLTASEGGLSGSDTVRLRVVPPPQGPPLEALKAGHYRIDNPLWNHRIKALVTRWLPHCIDRINDPDLPEGGINNFIEAAKKLAGRPHGRHRGYVFANAWVYNTIEAMCDALMLEAPGDPEIQRAQQLFRDTLEDWIPKILAAQEPDGYLHTLYTLTGRERWTRRGDHEGYVAGYFLDCAVAHFRMSNGRDRRLYEAAKKLADCWVRHIGPPPKKEWYDGHQAMEMALFRFAQLVEEVEGPGQGRPYRELGRFLLDARRGGSEYDQSHLPVVQQYEAVGHAVRAVYNVTAMADVVLLSGDRDYASAVESLWDNIVHRKYYLTGGIGSGETSEGFGPDYSLPNNAYCESCSSCGLIFFQHRMGRLHAEARYADLLEETLYNALLGSIDLAGENFYYQNPLEEHRPRYPWHGCPCCVGNIPRTLLKLPVWTYAKGADRLYVNLFNGVATTIPEVAGTEVELIQQTDYPWKGAVTLMLNPARPVKFTLCVRAPDRDVSNLYTATPNADGIESLRVNGQELKPRFQRGYALITRRWQRGDRVELRLPLRVQRVHAIPEVEADRGRVALRWGPLIYCLESVDQNVDKTLAPDSPLHSEWREGFLGGVRVILGRFADGTPLLAIPYEARNNRGGRSIVWIREAAPSAAVGSSGANRP